MASKRHHYVPQFYLNYFVMDHEAGGSTFWVYDKDGGGPRKQSPINTAVEGHFYSVDLGEGTRDDSLEGVLADLEGRVKPILDRWQGWPIAMQPDEVPLVAEFLAFMFTRVPRTVEMVKELGEAIAVKLLREVANRPDEMRRMWEQFCERHPALAFPFGEAEKAFQDPEAHFRVRMRQPAGLAFSLLLTGEVMEHLLSKHWCLCRAPEDSFFITSDTPLCVFHLDAEGMATPGAGIGLLDSEVAFPLSPQSCLLIDRRHNQPHLRIGRRMVTQINRRTVLIAERFVISPHKTPGVELLVKEFSKTRTMPKIDRSQVMPDTGEWPGSFS